VAHTTAVAFIHTRISVLAALEIAATAVSQSGGPGQIRYNERSSSSYLAYEGSSIGQVIQERFHTVTSSISF
jgi:hypothetical protein